jgi:hypothetical protein
MPYSPHPDRVDVPSTLSQLLLTLAFIVPGFVYQGARSRLRGPTPDDSNTATRILQALAVSAALDAVYMIALGPTLVDLADASDGTPGVRGVAEYPRFVGLLAFALLFAIPVGLAAPRLLAVTAGLDDEARVRPDAACLGLRFP